MLSHGFIIEVERQSFKAASRESQSGGVPSQRPGQLDAFGQPIQAIDRFGLSIQGGDAAFVKLILPTIQSRGKTQARASIGNAPRRFLPL